MGVIPSSVGSLTVVKLFDCSKPIRTVYGRGQIVLRNQCFFSFVRLTISKVSVEEGQDRTNLIERREKFDDEVTEDVIT